VSSQSGGKQTVMVVDDSDDVRELVALELRFSGYVVIEASDGREAVELAREKCPALIVMDIQMPVMDGLTATRMIRQIRGLCRMPIVAFSAFGADYRERAIEAGCDEYVSKAKGVYELTGIVRQYLTPI
jgi:two-component system cell cycle response regulator DivK